MVDTALLVLALALLAGLLMAERQTRTGPILAFKTPLSALFVAAALIQPHPIQSYYHWVLAGLVWGLIGDVCLALKGNRAFRAGLISFLLGHILYVVAFARAHSAVRLADLRTSVHSGGQPRSVLLAAPASWTNARARLPLHRGD